MPSFVDPPVSSASLLQAAVLDLPLASLFDSAGRRPPAGEGHLLLLKDALIRLILRGRSDVETLAAIRIRIDVILLPLVAAPDQPALGKRLEVGDLLRGIRRKLAKARLLEQVFSHYGGRGAGAHAE